MCRSEAYFQRQQNQVEVHIPGFSGQLYGKSMQVFFMKYIREERKFKSRELLKSQIEADIEALYWPLADVVRDSWLGFVYTHRCL